MECKDEVNQSLLLFPGGYFRVFKNCDESYTGVMAIGGREQIAFNTAKTLEEAKALAEFICSDYSS